MFQSKKATGDYHDEMNSERFERPVFFSQITNFANFAEYGMLRENYFLKFFFHAHSHLFFEYAHTCMKNAHAHTYVHA